MRKYLLLFGLLYTISGSIRAQDSKDAKEGSDGFFNSTSANKEEEPINCFEKWAKKFETRGADEVADGTYTDIIITVRNGSNANCFVGKCEVKEGKIIAMYMRLEDGKYELYKRKGRYEQTITINNGMSKTFITTDEELINVLFIKKLKPKKAEFQKAPDPDSE